MLNQYGNNSFNFKNFDYELPSYATENFNRINFSSQINFEAENFQRIKYLLCLIVVFSVHGDGLQNCLTKEAGKLSHQVASF